MIKFLQPIQDEPGIMVAIAAFGWIFFWAIILIPMGSIMNYDKENTTEKDSAFGAFIALTWLLGFVSQILLFFSDASGLQLFFCWIATIITIWAFCYTNKKMIHSLMKDLKQFRRKT